MDSDAVLATRHQQPHFVLCPPAFVLRSLAFLILASTLPAAEFVYEGKDAASWAKELKGGANREKAAHALTRLGREATPLLVDLLRDTDERTRAAAATILQAQPCEKEDVPFFLRLSTDEHFEVRRTALLILSTYPNRDPNINAALKDALNDADKAVVEAAEEALRTRRVPDIEPRAEPETSRTANRRKDPNTASARRDSEDGRRKVYEELLRQAGEQIKRGELERPARVLAEVQRIFPDEPRTAVLRKQLEAKQKELQRQPVQTEGAPKAGEIAPAEVPAPAAPAEQPVKPPKAE